MLLNPLELSLSDCGGGEGVAASALLALLLLPLLPPAGGGEREGVREGERRAWKGLEHPYLFRWFRLYRRRLSRRWAEKRWVRSL